MQQLSISVPRLVSEVICANRHIRTSISSVGSSLYRRVSLIELGDQISPICRRCKQSDKTCERPKTGVRFRSSPKSKRGPEFPNDQTWTDLDREFLSALSPLALTNHTLEDLQYVEESGAPPSTCAVRPSGLDRTKRTRLGKSQARSTSSPHTGSSSNTASLTQPPISLTHSSRNDSPSVAVTTQVRALLMRYFIQELAPWFDVCDPTRHFASVVPSRAFQSPTLLNAIYTASARHLASLRDHSTIRDSLHWQGVTIPTMTVETAVRFQNECIHDLLRSSLDPEQIMNEDLLAASIILRTDEEMDTPVHAGETDKQIFLRVTSAFIQTQIPTPMSPQNRLSHSLYSYAESDEPHSTSSPTFEQQSSVTFPIVVPPSGDERLFLNAMAWGTIRADGLRQACFWVAFRQELHGALMQQRSLDISLVPYQETSSFSPTEDSTWANRLIVFCAESAEYCYGNRASNAQIRRSTSTWRELKQKEQTFESLLPESFKPFYVQDPQPHEGVHAFPQMWYLDSIHATGAAYLELTKILLSAFDPGQQSLGLGHMTRVRNLGVTLRNATKKLCGIALSNRQAPPLFLNACSAIIMCGEQFEDPVEQQAILHFLDITQKNLAYPTRHIIESLQKAWISEVDAS